MIIQVIIDIPVAQVNRTFDYLVPKEWEDAIQLGLRVQVPFGSRQLLGFIVGISSTSDFTGKLKEITGLLDFQPFLNEELIELSEYAAEHLNVFRISMLQAMIPNLLKVKYEHYFIIKDPEAFKEATQFSDEIKAEYPRDAIEERLTHNHIHQLIEADIIELDYRVINQTTVKYIQMVTPLMSTEKFQDELEKVSKRSFRQRQLLEYFIDHPNLEKVEINQLIKVADVSRQVVLAGEDKGWLTISKEEIYRDPLKGMDIPKTENQVLKNDQQKAYDQIKPALVENRAETFLLEGVTGSGKTEVYLQLMDDARQAGKAAILLVPEISLTPQMVRRVVGRFQTGVAVLHSGLSTTERFDEWRRIISGEATIVVGARSSIFAPLENIGIIIIDEEHETTYKQADNPRYHARDIAKWRSEYHGAPLVLGSATPSLESRARAHVGNYTLIEMPHRINQSPLPPIKLIDMTQEMVRQTSHELSSELQEKIADRLEKNEQIILLLNRRGYASYMLCRECGDVLQCPRCDISLTYHKHDNQMKCHYCDYHQPVPTTCPSCGGTHMRTHGIGTQKVKETLEEQFKSARVIRMDNDTTRRKGDHERLLQTFSNHEADILLGTQMIAKGLDFEKVTLVGVINADTSLNLPDFRASEKTFQLLTQVSGRTGRGRYPGEVIIQTYNPDHYVMQLAQKHDYEQFFKYEMKRRHMAKYPPYFFTTLVSVSSKNKAKAFRKIYDLKAQLAQITSKKSDDFIILGPNQGSVARINEHYYYNLLLKYKDQELIQDALTEILYNTQKESKHGLYVNIDHEPLYFM